jgi:hypothetical protein
MVFMDPQLATYTASHDVLELKSNPGAPASATGETSEVGAPSSESGQ